MESEVTVQQDIQRQLAKMRVHSSLHNSLAILPPFLPASHMQSAWLTGPKIALRFPRLYLGLCIRT